MPVCQACHVANGDNARFCSNCGTQLLTPERSVDRERKTVSVLFCDLVGFTSTSDGADPEDVEATLRPFHTRSRREIERYGGTVEKFVGDAVMAVFGAPVAHEDDPERAVRAGLALVAAMAELNVEDGRGLEVRVGIATGEVVVSRTARPEIGEGFVAGDVVNSASRLQTAAPVGGVLVDEATHEASAASIEYATKQAIRVKGKSQALCVLQVVGARGSPGETLTDASTPMIGRVQELEAIRRAYLRAVREKSVQLVTVVGEPGLGKSRLLQAFADWVGARKELVTWRQGRCTSYGTDVTYAALSEVVRAQIGVTLTDPAEMVRARLVDAVQAVVGETDLASQQDWLVARLGPLVGLAAERVSRGEQFTAWHRFFRAIAVSRPLVLALEDLHWASPAMLDYLAGVLAEVSGVALVIVVTARPELSDIAAPSGPHPCQRTTLRLSPLTDAESRRLIATVWEGEDLPSEIEAQLLKRAGGNPLYAREYLRLLSTRRPATDQQPVDVAHDLPDSVQAVIAARLDTLSASEKGTLAAASVLGVSFWASALTSFLGLDEAQVSARCRALVERGFVRPNQFSSMAGQEEYGFTHALIRDVAYRQLPRTDRADYHVQAAAWHEMRIGDSSDSGDIQTEVIALHLTAAHELLVAAESKTGPAAADLAPSVASWRFRAGLVALRTDFSAAERHFQASVDLVADGEPARPRRMLELASVVLQRNSKEGLRWCEQARSDALAIGDYSTAAIALTRRYSCLRELGNLNEAIQSLQHAVRELESLPPCRELLEAYAEMSFAVGFQLAQYDEAVRLADAALALASRIGDPSGESTALALISRAWIRLWWELEPGGRDDLARATRLSNEHNLTVRMLQASQTYAVDLSYKHSARAASRVWLRIANGTRSRGDRSRFIVNGGNALQALVVAGLFAKAADYVDQDLSVELEGETTRPIAYAESVVAWLKVVTGDVDDAARRAIRALRISRTMDVARYSDNLVVLLECGDAVDATSRRHAEQELIDQIELSAPRWLDLYYLARLGRMLASLDRLDLVLGLLSEFPVGLPLADLMRRTNGGLLEERAGNLGPASELYRSAGEGFRRYGYPLEEIHAILGQARCESRLGAPAGPLIAHAAGLAYAIGARPLAREAIRLARIARASHQLGSDDLDPSRL